MPPCHERRIVHALCCVCSCSCSCFCFFFFFFFCCFFFLFFFFFFFFFFSVIAPSLFFEEQDPPFCRRGEGRQTLMSLHPLGSLLLKAKVHSVNIAFDAVSSTRGRFWKGRRLLRVL
ncbi:unnamed protein product [Effrenium voratum]|nr:unnamed protein product [Effrenium voratum]